MKFPPVEHASDSIIKWLNTLISSWCCNIGRASNPPLGSPSKPRGSTAFVGSLLLSLVDAMNWLKNEGHKDMRLRNIIILSDSELSLLASQLCVLYLPKLQCTRTAGSKCIAYLMVSSPTMENIIPKLSHLIYQFWDSWVIWFVMSPGKLTVPQWHCA